MKQGKSRFVFPGGNLPTGFHSFYRSGLSGIDNVFILKGGPGTGKSTLIRKIGLAMLERGFDVEFWQCSSDNDSLDGVLIPALAVAVIDGTAPHIVDPLYPGAVEEIINLGECWDGAQLKANKKEIIECSQQIAAQFAEAYGLLSLAGAAEQQRYQLYEGRERVKELQGLADNLTEEILRGEGIGSRSLFARAVTPAGLQSFIPSLTRDYQRRYFLSGPACRAKNKLIWQLRDEAEAGGRQTEVYYSPFDLAVIELLLLPERGIAVLALDDDELPELREGDRIIDLAAVCGEDSSLRTGDSELKSTREKLTAEAAAKIAAAKSVHDELESYYCRAMDFDAVDLVAGRLFNRLLALAAVWGK